MQSAYKQKAKEGLQRYLVIPDDPEFKRLKDAALYLSSIAYKEEATKDQSNFTSVPETPSLKIAKETQELQSEVKTSFFFLFVFFLIQKEMKVKLAWKLLVTYLRLLRGGI